MDGELELQQVIYQPRHEFILVFDEKFCDASFVEPGFRKTLEKKAPGLWAANIFTPKYCKLLLEEVGRMHETTGGKNLDSNGIPLLVFGFKPFFEEFTRQFEKTFIRPIYKHHVLELKTAFITGYDELSTRYHPIHEDDSSISVSVCLGEEFSGGEFCIAKHSLALREALVRLREVNRYGDCGKFDTRVLSKDVLEFVKQEPYRALIYQGRNLHGTTAVISGSRVNLVIWMTLYKPFPLFLQLPVELQSVVISHLPVSDILNMACVSKSMRALCDDEGVWEAVTARNPFPSTEGFYSSPAIEWLSDAEVQKLPAKERFRYLMRQSWSIILRHVMSQHYVTATFHRALRPYDPLLPMPLRPSDPLFRVDLDTYARDPIPATVVRVLSSYKPDNNLFPRCPLTCPETEVGNALAKYSYGQMFRGKPYISKPVVTGLIIVVNRGEKVEATSATTTRPVSAGRTVAVSKPLTSTPSVPVSSAKLTSSGHLPASSTTKLKPVVKPFSQAKTGISIKSSMAISKSARSSKLVVL